MATGKIKRKRLIIGDTVVIQNCNKLGFPWDTITGILIWRPMNHDMYTPQLYAIWVSKKLDLETQKNSIRILKSIYDRTGISAPGERCHRWQCSLWNQILDYSDKNHILFIPKDFYLNMLFLESEKSNIKTGDYVLDRRWYMRFGENPIKKVLAVKMDTFRNMEWICVENIKAEYDLAYTNWVYSISRKDLIVVSRETSVTPIVPKKNILNQILSIRH